MKLGKTNWLAVLLLLLSVAASNAAAVNEPYVADPKFNNGNPVYEVFDATEPKVITGEKLVLDFWTGDTVVAGLVPVTETGQTRYTVVLARYGQDGNHKTWSDSTPGAVSPSGKYVYVPYASAPSNVRAVAVRDITLGTNGDIMVLIDSRGVTTGARTNSLLAVFSEEGKFRGVITHMADASADNIGGSVLMLGGPIMIVSSQPSVGNGPSGARLIVKRYDVDIVAGQPTLPLLDTAFGTGGKVQQAIPGCSRTINGAPPIVQPMNCDLRVARAYSVNGPWLLIAGDYGNFHGNTSGQDPNYSRDLFVMKLVSQTGARDPTFGSNGLAAYATANAGASMNGMVVRYDSNYNPTDIFLLNAFPRACREGFIVAHLNGMSGTYIDRSFTVGGGGDADPNVCAHVSSFDANDMVMAKNGKYLGVAGGRYSGEDWTGVNASITLLNPDNLQSAPHQQNFSDNSGQYAGATRFNALISNGWSGAGDIFTALGTHYGYYEDGYEDPYSSAVTLRVLPDRIFRNGFEN